MSFTMLVLAGQANVYASTALLLQLAPGSDHALRLRRRRRGGGASCRWRGSGNPHTATGDSRYVGPEDACLGSRFGCIEGAVFER
jgi:hypothetical protein